ncbi:SET domain-containing protein 9 isoform X2 [Gouania willdenowi]|uniref:SET domain-containing protein 9 isoform X2 n=1 Tax=Gouania willdenowi TaxID=441366 RepID=UPI0010550DB1|nr:SET domain-containing protein 9 isoform X2 [Gouania willdenowi]
MLSSAVRRFLDKWKSYRHRFVPWVVFNLKKNEQSLRKVDDAKYDKLVPDGEVSASLLKLFTVLHRIHYGGKNHAELRPPPHDDPGLESREADAVLRCLGFNIHRRPSSVPGAGTGTIYQPYEPILLQSIRNPFVFRCIDGILVDGNDRGISRMVFRSCSGRDRLGPLTMSDTSWLTDSPLNPLAVGQYVNNCSRHTPANVCYQEFDVPGRFPLELHRYLPNVNYSQHTRGPLRCVVLVALRDIKAGEELFSNYYTIVH